MNEKEKRDLIRGWPVYAVFLLLIAAVYWAAKTKPPRPEDVLSARKEVSKRESGPVENLEPATMREIISGARTWRPAWRSWYGKTAKNFTFKDITGKSDSLHNLRGKNVAVIFWATWCGPCISEIPHLKELRELFREQDLEIVAISNENPGLVKSFAEKYQLNYTVASVENKDLPAPFNSVRSIPSGFYIDRQGKIKVATEGLITLHEMQGIIRAKE